MNPNQCEACKFQNKQCGQDCIFAPLFPSEYPFKFEVVNKIFGLEVLNFFLKDLSPKERILTARTFYSEAKSCYVDSLFGDSPNDRTGLLNALKNYANQKPKELLKTKKLLAHHSRPTVVLALAAVCRIERKPKIASSNESKECLENELLEPSVNGDETKAE